MHVRGRLCWHPHDEQVARAGICLALLGREERFGYVKLASQPKLEARDFIYVEQDEGKRRVEFAVEKMFDLDTGRVDDD